MRATSGRRRRPDAHTGRARRVLPGCHPEEPRGRTVRRHDQQGACRRLARFLPTSEFGTSALRATAWRRVPNRRQVGRSRRLRGQHRSVLPPRACSVRTIRVVAMDIVRRTRSGSSANRRWHPPVPIPALGNGIIDIPGNVIASTVEEEFNRGYTQSYNVTVQRELVGVRRPGRLRRIANRPPAPDDGAQLRCLAVATPAESSISSSAAASTTLQLPYEDGTGRYDSLQATLTRRFSGGFQLQTSYTFSKSMSWATSWMDPSQFHRNRALSSFDRPHNLQIGWVAELPFGEGKPSPPRASRLLFGGWQLNGISANTVARRSR